MCDGDSDCEDNSDEDNCDACKLSHHVCANDSTICLPPEKLCNGADDCPDGSDEKLCGTTCNINALGPSFKGAMRHSSLIVCLLQTCVPWAMATVATTVQLPLERG